MKKLLPTIILTLSFTAVQAKEPATKVIAHRGYWNTEGSAQNSVAALKKAAEIGVYGSEFDVHVTSDGIPILNHDDTINGLKIESHPYTSFAGHLLPNGERIPTLAEYLAEGSKYPEMKLILEIKSASAPELETRWTELITGIVNEMGLREQVEYIAFSLHICKEIVRLDPHAKVAYLNGDLAPDEVGKIGLTGIDYYHKVLEGNIEWLGQARMSGLTTNVWTVNDTEKMKFFIENGIDYITTDKPEVLKSLPGTNE